MLRKILCAFTPIALAVVCAAHPNNQPQIVDLSAADGTLLKASYFAAAQPGPGILLLHQCNQQRKIWDPLAQALSAAGVNVLTVDYRGFGESGGPRFDQLSTQERIRVTRDVWPGDIDVAFQYLLSQPGVQRDKIAAGGGSCGVENSVELAIRNPKVKALILLAGPMDRNGRLFLGKAKRPVFAGFADDDPFADSTWVMRWFFSLSSNPESRLQHYATGGHAAEIFAVHPEFAALIAQWSKAVFSNQPGAVPQTNGSPLPASQLKALKLMDQQDGVNKAVKMLSEAHEHDPAAAVLPEAVVNTLGYERLQMNDPKAAVEILKLNVLYYPNSPNVYDSLGDAYLAAGQKELARNNAKRVLELLASDTADNPQRKQAIKESAEKKLQQVGN